MKLTNELCLVLLSSFLAPLLWGTVSAQSGTYNFDSATNGEWWNMAIAPIPMLDFYAGTAQCTRLLEAAFLGILNVPTLRILRDEPMFALYTRKNTHREVLEVTADGKVKSKFYDSKNDTKFIIHGFLGSGTNQWILDLKDALLEWGHVNVIVVDWQVMATVRYPVAASNTAKVAEKIVQLINALIAQFGGNLDCFHLIGHSLGSHVAGYAGAGLGNKIARISGLDPAGPLFSEAPNDKRLDASDAKFVDVIHTDKECLGTRNPRGLVAFYPNGGSQQPGCGLASLALGRENKFDGTLANLDSSFCSHFRAVKYYTESIRASTPLDQRGNGNVTNTNCQFKGSLCDSYERYLKGECNASENEMECFMGIDADLCLLRYSPGAVIRKYFLRTNSWSPFCRKN